MSINDLPDEIIDNILRFIPPNELFNKFFRSLALTSQQHYRHLSNTKSDNIPIDLTVPILRLSYMRIFRSKIVVKNRSQKEREMRFRLSKIRSVANSSGSSSSSAANSTVATSHRTYGPGDPKATPEDDGPPHNQNVFEIVDFHEAYNILIQLLTFNMNTTHNIFPQELEYSFYVHSQWDKELEIFSKILEVLAFDTYYYKDAIPRITVEITYAIPPETVEVCVRNNNILKQVESLNQKMHKISIVNHFSPQQVQQENRGMALYVLNPLKFNNLVVLHLINNGISGNFKPNLGKSARQLQVLDIRSNNITSLQDLTLPESLVELRVSSNTLTSLSGPNYSTLPHLRLLDASINAISSIDGIEWPPNLNALKLDYNSIESISFIAPLPASLEFLSLSKNYELNSFEGFELPPSLKELYLDGNNIKSLPQDFFYPVSRTLKVLSLKENSIDDLDDLGILPPSLSTLLLDDNEIDYFNWNNIMSLPNLYELSMSAIGLMSIDYFSYEPGVYATTGGSTGGFLPSSLKKLDFSNNQISEISPILLFSNALEELKLNDNRLTTFSSPSQINSLVLLDLSHNMISSISDIDFTNLQNLRSLSLSGLKLRDHIDYQFLSSLPSSQLQELDISDLSPHQDHHVCSNREATHGLDSMACACKDSYYELNADFSRFGKLSTLLLNGNRITKIGPQTKFPPSLKYLCIETHLITSQEGHGAPSFTPISGNYISVNRKVSPTTISLSETKWYKYNHAEV